MGRFGRGVSRIFVGACRKYDAGLSGQSEVDARGCSESLGSGSGDSGVRDAGVVLFGGDDVSLPVPLDGDLPRYGSFVVAGSGGVRIGQSSERVLSAGGSG